MAEDTKVLAGRVARGEAKEISKLAAGCHSSPVAGVTTAVSISLAATHASTPAVSEINEQAAKNATPERR